MIANSSDFLNLVFILLSAVLALFLPFELFLFSYAFLGPLHYLTEINWLKSKKYFSKSKLPIYFILAVTGFVGLLYLNSYFKIISFSFPKSRVVTIATYIILMSFMFVLFTELFKEKLTGFKYHLLFIFAIAILFTVIVLKNNYHAHLVTFVFLPTLIHVFIFTFLFMWIGYLKKPNAFALFSLLLMMAFPLAIAFIPVEVFFEKTAKGGIEMYINSGFQTLNTSIYSIVNGSIYPESNFYETAQGLKIQSFIAFAYTYHYLNWFAKINIVGWAKSISNTNFTIIICLWIFAISLYVYNFKLGLMALFFMSLGHVLLEFPLNIRVMKGIVNHYQLKLKSFFR